MAHVPRVRLIKHRVDKEGRAPRVPPESTRPPEARVEPVLPGSHPPLEVIVQRAPQAILPRRVDHALRAPKITRLPVGRRVVFHAEQDTTPRPETLCVHPAPPENKVMDKGAIVQPAQRDRHL